MTTAGLRARNCRNGGKTLTSRRMKFRDKSSMVKALFSSATHTATLTSTFEGNSHKDHQRTQSLGQQAGTNVAQVIAK
jgi:uncharacterized protein YukE